jgi:hypothetical protein
VLVPYDVPHHTALTVQQLSKLWSLDRIQLLAPNTDRMRTEQTKGKKSRPIIIIIIIIIIVKGKIFPVHAMKAGKGSRRIAPLIIYLGNMRVSG